METKSVLKLRLLLYVFLPIDVYYNDHHVSGCLVSLLLGLPLGIIW